MNASFALMYASLLCLDVEYPLVECTVEYCSIHFSIEKVVVIHIIQLEDMSTREAKITGVQWCHVIKSQLVNQKNVDQGHIIGIEHIIDKVNKIVWNVHTK